MRDADIEAIVWRRGRERERKREREVGDCLTMGRSLLSLMYTHSIKLGMRLVASFKYNSQYWALVLILRP